MLQQSVADIFNIKRPLLHILIIQQIKHRNEVIDCFFHCYFSRFVLTLYDPLNFIHKYRIFQYCQMSIEYGGFLSTHHIFNFTFYIFNLIL